MPKQIGDIEKRILRTLALNPDQHTQSVQKSLKHKNYTTIMNALKRLRNEKGLVTSKEGISEKGVTIQLYRLSQKGENHVLMSETFTTKELDRFIENYAETAEVCKLLKEQHTSLGTELMAKVLSGYATLGKVKQEGSDGQAQKMIAAALIADLKKGDDKKMDSFINEFTKRNPRLKKKVRTYLKKKQLL